MGTNENKDNLDHFGKDRESLFSRVVSISLGVLIVLVALMLLSRFLGNEFSQKPEIEPDQVAEELPHTGSLEEGGTIEGTLDMAGNSIVNIGPPEKDTDVISKGGADDRFVNVTGDTMIGNLIITDEKDLILDSSADLLLGDTYLNESTSSTDSGASLVGTFDEFNNSSGTNIQDVLDDLDLATSNILTETDPIFSASPAAGISNTNTSNWNTTFGWGDHSTAGYLTSESDPIWSAAEPSYFNLGQNETVSGRPAFNGGVSGVSAPFSADSNYLVSNLNSDLLDGINSLSFLRSDTSDAFEAGNTLTFTGSTDFNGDITISDQTIAFDAATFSAFDLTGDLRILASGDNDDYIYINTASNIPYLFFEQGNANDAGFRVNGTDLEYRNEGGSWASLASLGASLWTDLGSELTPTGSESIQLGDTDWIGIGPAAERIIFDDASGDISIMGATVGIGTTDPGSYTLNVEGGSNHGIYALTSGASAYALRGDSTGTGGFGMYGSSNSNTGYAVYGTNSNSGYGVYGASDGYAIYGSSSSGTAGYFTSTSGYGMIVEAGNVGIGTTAPDDFALQVNGSIGPDSAPTISTSSNNTLTTVDSSNFVGLHTSTTIGNDDLPVISHYDTTNDDLRVCKCNDTSCTSASCSSIDTTGDVGIQSSIAVGTDGLPLISHFDDTNDDIRVCKCNNTSCTSATCSSIVSVGSVGSWSSIDIAIGIDELAITSYFDDVNDNLHACKCDNISCTTASCSTIETTDNLGQYSSIAIGTDGLPIISHCDNTNGDLRVCKCDNTSCTSASCSAIDTASNVGQFTSIAIGTDSLPVISHYDTTTDDLRVCKCDNTSCSSASCSSIDTANNVGMFSSIAIGTDGLPVISHYDITTDDLRVCKCDNASCTSASCSSIDTGGFVGLYTSIAIGDDGLPIISHHNEGMGYLRIAKCASESCQYTSTGASYNGGSDLGSRGKYFNNVYGVNYWAKEGMQISNFDLAEDYKAVDSSITSGDVVAPAYGSNISIDKTQSPYQSDVIGVVSTEPGLHLTEWTLSQEEKKLMRPVALAGRVPVKVTCENGPIEKDDYLVPASKPGYAMKACGSKYCQTGTVIGRALEDFGSNHLGDTQQVTQELQDSKEEVVNQLSVISGQSSYGLEPSAYSQEQEKEITEEIQKVVEDLTQPITSDYGEGRIMMFINLSWFNPPSPITELDQSTGYDFNTFSSPWSGNLDTIDNYQFTSNLTPSEGVFGHINVDSMTVGDLNITGLLTSREIKAGVLKAFEGENIIIKLSDTLEKTAFTIENSLGETVFKIDRQGKISIKEDTQSPSVGRGAMKAGETSVRINTNSVTGNSKVLVNPTVTTDAQLAVIEKAENKYFVVSIEHPVTYDLTFDWWLIN